MDIDVNCTQYTLELVSETGTTLMVVCGTPAANSGHIIQADGIDVTPRAKINFVGFDVTDNEANVSTDISQSQAAGNYLSAVSRVGVNLTGSGTVLDPLKFQAVDWGAETLYRTLQLIIYEGELYRVTTEFTSGATFDATNLERIEPKVATPVTPDYTAITVGDKLQEVAKKVAGLQEKNVTTIITLPNTTLIEINTDLQGDFAILTYCDGFIDSNNDPQDNRIHLNLNDNYNNVYGWAGYLNYITPMGSRRAVQYSTQIFRRIGNEYLIEQHNFYVTSREAYASNTKGLNATNGVSKISLVVNILGYSMVTGTTIKIIRL